MPLAAATRLGPYEIRGLLGAGGMGEVYRALDPRLGREVAVKVLPEEVGRDPERLARFEREARAVAALSHPNILTVHDVGTHEGTPYVVMELLEGETLRELLSRRAPTQRQVLALAVQAARGLEAAHAKGILHRDLKPENLFVTTDGRLKILDFGLAKLVLGEVAGSQEATASSPSRPGQMLGTVGYMSPEQVRGRGLDGRSDLFSLGVVLYELLGGKHPFRRETAVATLTAILEDGPAPLSAIAPSVPPALGRIVARCLEKVAEDRVASAHDLAVALEAIQAEPAGPARVPGLEERSPYPGLFSFTEKDAGVFFGREDEVEALWGKVRARRLLALIGPSGVGKTSFLRAGLLPAREEGWAALVFTPGPAPFRGLGHALAPELGSDPEALRMLVDVDDPAAAFELATRWRKAHAEALLVVDQFEELFTLGSREVQASFTGLLGRLAREADVHVLLSMRDDFLIRCSEQPPIAPVFESLTPLAPLSGEALRRAVVAPAGKRGCSFEDEALVEEMLASVEGARGALPLVAFAVAQLWEKRDREKRLLTRAAYQEIGGVAGALAQHAEATLERIGVEHQAMVREVFRNLVTAQGTRAAADREELLSVFPEGKVAEDVLGTLIDARLLTSYEVPAGPGGANEATPGEEGTRHRIEIVHESLLKAWPRLVWWQAQDEEGAHLRDQLKQAAHLWEEKGRPADLLWTGTSFQEFELWRRRYPGKLTSLEEDFARSMAERARRRRRLRRLVVGSVLAAAVAVAAVTGLLWRRSELARDRAQAEARRAEASKLLALGRAELDRYPTAAVAYARKSLEIADTPEGRKLVVEALWRGPVARILSPDRIVEGPDRPANPGWGVPVFSPDAKWLALENDTIRRLLLFPWDGGAPRHVPPRSSDANAAVLGFGPQSDLLVSGGPGASVRFWSLPALQEIRRVELGGVRSEGWFGGGMLFTQTQMAPGDEQRRIRGWSLPGGEPRSLGTVDWHGVSWTSFDSEGHRLAYSSGRSVHLRRLDDASGAPSRLLGSHADAVTQVTFFPVGDRVASVDQAGEIRIWSLASHALKPWRFIHGVGGLQWLLAVDDQGTRLARGELASSVHLWDFRDPPDAEPLLLKRPDVCYAPSGAFDPRGWWLASGNAVSIAFWPLIHPWKRSFPGAHPSTYQLEFTPDGRWLASCTLNEAVRLWPLGPADGAVRSLTPSEPCWGLAAHPASTHLLVGTWPDGRLLLAPISGGAPRPLPTGWEGAATTGAMAFDPAGRRAAACPWAGMLRIKDPQHRVLRVWDLESGRGRSYSLANITDSSWMCDSVAFAPDGAVFVGGNGGVLRLTLPEDSGGTVAAETVHAAGRAAFVLSRDGRKLLVWAGRNPNAVVFDELLVFDLTAHTSRRITTHGRRLWCAAFDPTGRIVVTGDIDGVVRAGLATGEEPHLLFGHAAHVTKVAISPDGRWIVSASDDALNLWPMPDLTKPPLHTLPHAELMARLDALTNLRVARDLSSAIGWKLDVGPFPGWKDVPTW